MSNVNRRRSGTGWGFAFETEPHDASSAADTAAAPGNGDFAATPKGDDAGAVPDDVADSDSDRAPDTDADAAATDQPAAAPEPPLWRTPSGDVLHLPPHVLNQLMAWLRRRASMRRPSATRPLPRPRVRRGSARRERRAALRRVGRIARGARRIGTLRHRPSGRRFPVFRSRFGRGATRLITRRRPGARFEILAIEPEIGTAAGGFTADELEVLSARSKGAWQPGAGGKRFRVRGAQVSIDWHGPLTLRNAARKHGAGVYVVYRDRKPIYVGETNSFSRRWTLRFDVLRNLAIDSAPFTVWVGTIQQLDMPKVSPELLRQDVEHVLVRFLKRALRPSGADVTNRSPTEPLLANKAGILIRNSSTRAPFLPQAIRLSAGQQLEVAELGTARA